MPRCPVCQSVRIVIVVSPKRRAFCTACGAKWIQEGSVQRAVRPGLLRTSTQGATPAPIAET